MLKFCCNFIMYLCTRLCCDGDKLEKQDFLSEHFCLLAWGNIEIMFKYSTQ